MIGGVEIGVEGSRVVRLVARAPVAAKVLSSLSGPVVMLVGSAAGLLEGDTIRVSVSLAAGAWLTLRTTAATIAHPCRSGGGTALEVDGRLGAGARLAWLPEPLIACAGCDHVSRSRLELEGGAMVAWLDTVTLGRSGEQPGDFQQRLDVTLDGRPLLREALRVGPRAGISPVVGAGPVAWDGPAVLGGHRHVGALHLLGGRVPGSDDPRLMQLSGLGTTARLLARRGDDMSRQVASLLPRFLHPLYDPCPDPARSLAEPGTPSQCPKEAVHV